MKIHVLGTGNGGALECYNTCFAIENAGKYLLVDGGGGNQILTQLKKANINITDIHDVFITHIHTDHILGLIWIIRTITAKMRFSGAYEGNLNVYGGEESIKTLRLLIHMLFPPAKQFMDTRLKFNVVKDKDKLTLVGLNFEILDTCAKKEPQFGFIVNNQVCFTGDEPLKAELFERVKDHDWLLHEAFCLDSEEEKFKAHFKGHGTVKEVAELAEKLNIKNLVMWHTQDNQMETRKENYTKEAKLYFKGNVFIPDDLDVIDIRLNLKI